MTSKIDNTHYLDDTLCMTVVPLNVCIGIQYDSPVVLGEGEFNRYHLYSWVDWHVLHSCLVVLQRGFSLFCDNISKELSLRQTLWYLVDFISFKEIANHLVKKISFPQLWHTIWCLLSGLWLYLLFWNFINIMMTGYIKRWHCTFAVDARWRDVCHRGISRSSSFSGLNNFT